MISVEQEQRWAEQFRNAEDKVCPACADAGCRWCDPHDISSCDCGQSPCRRWRLLTGSCPGPQA